MEVGSMMQPPMPSELISMSPRTRFRTAMIVALIADALELGLLPLFAAGAASPPDDILDVVVGAIMAVLLGWHWEFAPSFLAKLVPGVDLAPLWTLAVANVYRKAKQAGALEGVQVEIPAQRDPRNL
jgi:hypothetical protein